MKFGIVVNVSRESALVLARKVAAWMDERHIDYVFEALSAEKLHLDNAASIEDLSAQCDAVLSLGGMVRCCLRHIMR